MRRACDCRLSLPSIVEPEREHCGVMVGNIGHSIVAIEHLKFHRSHSFEENMVDNNIVEIVSSRISLYFSETIVSSRSVGVLTRLASIAHSRF